MMGADETAGLLRQNEEGEWVVGPGAKFVGWLFVVAVISIMVMACLWRMGMVGNNPPNSDASQVSPAVEPEVYMFTVKGGQLFVVPGKQYYEFVPDKASDENVLHQ